jgi:hypothetical protein
VGTFFVYLILDTAYPVEYNGTASRWRIQGEKINIIISRGLKCRRCRARKSSPRDTL